MSIQDRQNRPESLQKLEATSVLYHRAKWARSLGFSLVIFVAMLLIAMFVTKNETFSHFVAFVAIVTWFIDQIVLKAWERTIKKEAATIQEEFDCFVLDLPWPEHKGINHPTPDRLKELAIKASKHPRICAKLKDWYTPNAIPDEPDRARVHCQRMNCWWDVQLRRKWKTFLRSVFWCFVTVTLLVSVVTGLTVAKLIALAASNLRVLAWGINEIRDQSTTIDHISGLHRYLSSFSSEKPISPSESRRIQDEIFEHRCSNPPVPNWFYRLNRDNQELEAGKPENRETF